MRRTPGNVFCLTIEIGLGDGDHVTKTIRRHQMWDDTIEDVAKDAERHGHAFMRTTYPKHTIQKMNARGWNQTWYADPPYPDAQ